jgi:hypothetical protein
VISDIWRCDGREILPLMPMSGSPLIRAMPVITLSRSGLLLRRPEAFAPWTWIWELS